MILQPEDMKSVIDAYKLEAITDNDETITASCLAAAEAKVLSYLSARYDVATIAMMSNIDARLADLCEIIKDIALYYIMRRHNVDIAFERVAMMYQEHTRYLLQVSRGEITLHTLPKGVGADGQPSSTIVMGSNPKKDYNF